MAIRAGHVAFQNGMAIRKLEFGFLFHVAGKTHFGVLAGIDDLVALPAPVLRMQTARTVTHLAPFHFDAFHGNGDPFVGRKLEVLDLFLVACGTSLGTDIGSAGHLVIFQDFLEGFYIIFATGGKKEGTT
jgi:hypothetical protein